MKPYKLPEEKSLQESLLMILGEEPELATLESLDSASHVALFINEDQQVVSSCSVDLSGAAALSCGLSLIPPAMADEMIKDKKLTDIASENLYEVMNIFSSLFMDNDTPHLKLSSVALVDEVSLPSDDACETTENIFSVTSGKYQPGIVSFSRYDYP
ncbi:MAG: hypothetical protein AB8B48_21970 [Pseudomonadales bacterium]